MCPINAPGPTDRRRSSRFEPQLFDAFPKDHAGQKCGNEYKALGGREEPEGLIRNEPKR
jgi:hypothetical protein